MTECIVRIDDRLIHGQVIVGWVHRLNLKNIVIVNDTVCANAMRRRLMLMAVPDNIHVDFYNISNFIASFKGKSSQFTRSCIILFENASDLVKCIKNGVLIAKINVGGLHYQEGKMQLAPFLSVNDDDIKALKYLIKHDVALEGRALPLDEKVDVAKLLEG